MMRPKVLISQKIFDEAMAMVKKDFEVEENQTDTPLPANVLKQKLQGKVGAIILLTDQIDDNVLSQCLDLKIICNVAVGCNNIDIEACTRRRIMVTNTPGVLETQRQISPGHCSSLPQGELLKQTNIFAP